MAKGHKTGGRQKGTPNKTTALLKDAILKAATEAGGEEELVGYLKTQAKDNPGPFLALLGKVLPMQIAGDADDPLRHHHVIEQVIVDPADRGSKGTQAASGA